METQQYDGIIIGAGQAGGPLATALAQAGWRTALIEREHVGGTCVNEGCTPTQTMVASARVAHLARRAADYGVLTGPVAVQMAVVRQRKRAIVESWRYGSERRLGATSGLDLIFGEASFAGEQTLRVRLNSGGERKLSARQIFINTGARPSIPPVIGIEGVPYLTSTSAMELDAVPEHLLVLGGGYVGLEFAQMFLRFGSRVTIVQGEPQLLPHEDADVAQAIAEILDQDGVELLLRSEAVRVERVGERKLQLTIVQPGGQCTVEGSHLLVAAGRTPNTEHLHLEAAGVLVDERGYVPVNPRLETNVSGVYALGDVNGGPAFTHIAYDDYRIIRANLIESGDASTRDRIVPYTIFTDPQLGRVGLTEREACARGHTIRVAKLPMSYVARAIESDETRGFMKALVDAASGQILGAAILGVEGGEVMSVLQMAMLGQLPYTTIRDGVFAHPTLAESLNNLFMAMDAT